MAESCRLHVMRCSLSSVMVSRIKASATLKLTRAMVMPRVAGGNERGDVDDMMAASVSLTVCRVKSIDDDEKG